MLHKPYAPTTKYLWLRSLQISKHLDVTLFLPLLLLMILGLGIFYSAADQNMALLKRQAIHVAIGFAAMFTLAQAPINQLKRWAPWCYTIGLIMLVLVIFLGTSSKGAQRWLDLGFIRFQPSEVLKLATPMMVAYYLDTKILPIQWKDLLVSFIIIALPTSLVLLQPDLGTSLLIFGVGFIAIFFAGLNYKFIISLATLAIASMPLLWYFMHDYQQKRVLTFLNPESDPLGSGYHIMQSKIAIGSGGIFGKGWLQGTQTQLGFLPEQNTDFIFSVLSEEFGFTGILVLISLYMIVVIRGLHIGMHAQDTFSRILAGSLTTIFLVYVIVNIGMTCGLLPVVGVPLPLISYGGTSMVTLMLSFGILMSIQSHRTLLSK